MRKTFAQLKRDLKVGTKVKTIKTWNINLLGEIREISIVGAKRIAFKRPDGRDSFLWFDKASDVVYEDNKFAIYHNGELQLEYEILQS